jgi:hypothetical protein
LHVIHNSALLTVDRWFPALNPEAATAASTGGLGWPVLAVAAAVAIGGWCLVILSTKSPAEAARVS